MLMYLVQRPDPVAERIFIGAALSSANVQYSADHDVMTALEDVWAHIYPLSGLSGPRQWRNLETNQWWKGYKAAQAPIDARTNSPAPIYAPTCKLRP
jgi:hypothetical protein